MNKKILLPCFATTVLLCCFQQAIADSELIWAVNVGGSAYTSVDGTKFVAEEHVRGGDAGSITQVKGASDVELYRSYRRGDVEIAYPIANGSYDVTFYFAEPDELARGERLFDAFAEGERVIDDLDVMLFRDGKVRSDRKSTRLNSSHSSVSRMPSSA